MADRDIRIKYSKLSRSEKEVVGSALVKVNMGVAMPDDLKKAAQFLKGTGFIAKAGGLEEVIELLHAAPVISKKQPETVSLIHQTVSHDSAKELEVHQADHEKTITDVQKARLKNS